MKKIVIILTAVLFYMGHLHGQTSVQDTVCANSAGVQYFVTDTLGSTYSWNVSGGTIVSGNGTDTIAVDWSSAIGTDSVSVIETNVYGCVGDQVKLAVTKVDPPIADAGVDVTIGACGQYAQLNAGSSSGAGTLSYSWSPVAGLSNPNSVNPTASPTTTTTYTVTVTSSHGCSSSDQVVVTVDNPVIADAGSNVAVCLGGTTTLDATASQGTTLSYEWSAPGYSSTMVSPTVSPADTTTYMLIVTDTYGCSDTAYVTVNVTPGAVANAGPDDDVCQGADYSLGGSFSNASGVLWSTSGDGTFNDNTIAAPVYSPGPGDIANGNVTLTMTANGSGSCANGADDVIITISPKPNTSPIFHF